MFKNGLQSTYNKAKNWNIPIVSILWIEACKKHLVLMDPNSYQIANVDRYENPDLYGKIKVESSMENGKVFHFFLFVLILIMVFVSLLFCSGKSVDNPKY